MAIMMPSADKVAILMNKGSDTVLKTFLIIVLSCGTLPPIHRSTFRHVRLSLCVS